MLCLLWVGTCQYCTCLQGWPSVYLMRYRSKGDCGGNTPLCATTKNACHIMRWTSSFLHQKIAEHKRLAYIGWQDHNYIVHEIKTSLLLKYVYIWCIQCFKFVHIQNNTLKTQGSPITSRHTHILSNPLMLGKTSNTSYRELDKVQAYTCVRTILIYILLSTTPTIWIFKFCIHAQATKMQNTEQEISVI